MATPVSELLRNRTWGTLGGAVTRFAEGAQMALPRPYGPAVAHPWPSPTPHGVGRHGPAQGGHCVATAAQGAPLALGLEGP